MADAQLGNIIGVTAVGPETVTPPQKTNINGGTAIDAGFTSPNFVTIAAMKARLTAINGAYYTAARLNGLSYNDMMYAIRVYDSPLSLG